MSTLDVLTSSAMPAGFAAIFGVLTVEAANAQNYPTRPIRLVVPFPPAGSNDIVGRAVAGALGDRLGKQVVVDNRAGGNSIIGTDIVANALPDGYTLLVSYTIGKAACLGDERRDTWRHPS